MQQKNSPPRTLPPLASSLATSFQLYTFSVSRELKHTHKYPRSQILPAYTSIRYISHKFRKEGNFEKLYFPYDKFYDFI